MFARFGAGAFLVCAAAVVSAFETAATPAASPTAGASQAIETCDTPLHREFDFWVGNWLVFDASTAALVAFGRIEKELRGCALVERMTWLSDQFRQPGFEHRVAGMSLSAARDGRWTQLWVDDTYGGGLVVEGERQPDGSMILTTTSPRDGRLTRGHWIPGADGTVRKVASVSRDGGKTWNAYLKLLYRPNR